MDDISHAFGGDIAWSSTGDLLTSTGPLLTQERLLRRLLTNQGDDLHHLEYGAGLARFVGDPVHPMTVRGLVKEQVAQEEAVQQSPAPSVALASDNVGTVYLTVAYTDADGTPQALKLNLAP